MKAFIGIIALMIGVAYISADTGHEGATRIERGSYAATRRVAFTDASAVAFVTANNRRPDVMCKNYSSFTVFIGSNAAGTTLQTIGLPTGASEYFRIDGSYTGELFVIGEAGGSGSMACIEGLVY